MPRTETPSLPADTTRELRIRAFREAIGTVAARLRRDGFDADRKEY
jgi:hypothetical protein